MSVDTGSTSTHSEGQLGVDVGGTFTDLVFYDSDRVIHCIKVPSDKQDPARSTLDGLVALKANPAVAKDGWEGMHHTHSSTVATNALIERDGPELGMLVTAGFRDVLGLQRFALPHPMRYDSRRETPLIRRKNVLEIPERMAADGQVLRVLDEDGVREAGRSLLGEGVTTIVVCYLHSYRNAAHEKRSAEILRSEFPDLTVELSSEVWPQAREFERATLTAMNAFVSPTISRYADDLIRGLQDLGIQTPARVARSNGGMELLSTLKRRPVNALLSGPAAGVSGAAVVASEAGWRESDLLTIDVGGTSADVGVIRRGQGVLSSEEHVAGFPMLIPSIAVSAIGAGGGSVLWCQNQEILKVGPRSVGAFPGPACYGRPEAHEAALSDAFLVCGLLADGQRLAGTLELQAEPAAEAIERLGLGSAQQVAADAIRVAVAMMAAEAMNVLSRRGVDVEEFRLVAYGGAGPLVAALLAEEIHIRSVLLPHTPGALSAFGAARADLEGDLIQPVYGTLDELTAHEIGHALTSLDHTVGSWVAEETEEFDFSSIVTQYFGEMRYEGQGYDVTVPLEKEWLENGDVASIASAFHRAHGESYGHASESASIRLNEIRAHVLGSIPRPEPKLPDSAVETASSGSRTVHLLGESFECTVYERSAIGADAVIEGPAIIEQMDTTSYVPPDWTAHMHPSRHLILQRQD